MFGGLSFDKPKVRVYFEDSVGKELFRILFKAFRNILNATGDSIYESHLRHSSGVKAYVAINDRIRVLRNMESLSSTSVYYLFYMTDKG